MEAKIYLISLMAVREDGTFEHSPAMLISAGSLDEVTEEARSFALETYPEGGEWFLCDVSIAQPLTITDVMQVAVDEERKRVAEVVKERKEREATQS